MSDAQRAVDYYKAAFGAVAPVHEDYGWRTGRLTDPFGHDWEMSKPLSS
ncbi:MAG: hypothetical protein M3Z28_12600 [Candidatus Dormibacteraeota bacterium]|nr:hypothetical protein [Candidatus Dormibacteraeota bacterium]